jgi:hypothetical protein
MDENKLNTYIQTIIHINDKYKHNNYIVQRLELHLSNLEELLENENKKNNERICKFNELTKEQDNFYKVFLSKHQYYYVSYNNTYYKYDGKTYKIIKEDDIHYQLLSTITNQEKLIKWKHKTKQTVIKKIKERNLFKSIPETYTIQNILGFLRTIFSTKVESKYFLTIIGDCIFKKNTNNILYFVNANLKKFLTLIDSIICNTTGISIIHNFITKYHDNHKINMYRLIKTNETTNLLSNDIIKNVLNNVCINLLCVATHYSDRYLNADNYLNTIDDEIIKNQVLYFNNHSLETVIQEFIDLYIEKVVSIETNTNITWKNMHYIWKIYLSNINIPNMVYSQNLQEIFMDKMPHKNELGNIIFLNVTSKYIPNVSSFLTFWDKHIIITNDNNINDNYEIDEIIILYKNHKKNTQITDTNIISMIFHYFHPQVNIVDNKYITNIKCNLWLKCDDINEFLINYKNSNKINNTQDIELISFNNLYQSYKTYFNAKEIIDQKIHQFVSKNYFDTYINNKLQSYINYDKFVSSKWLED